MTHAGTGPQRPESLSARPTRHLRAVPPPPQWTSHEVAELIELAWTVGRKQKRLGIVTWRDRAAFADRIAVIVTRPDAAHRSLPGLSLSPIGRSLHRPHLDAAHGVPPERDTDLGRYLVG